MIRLPSLIADRLQWQLPLSDDGVCGLLGGLLADDLDQATSRFTELLADEPSLLLWSVCRSPRWQADPPKGLREVALWLAQHGLNVLHWDEGGPSAVSDSSLQLHKWAELAGHSVAVSRLAAAQHREPSSTMETPNARDRAEVPHCLTLPSSVTELQHGPSSTAFGTAGDETSAWPSLFGLLHNAREWLATCGPAPGVTDTLQEVTCLPSWLVQWLDDLESQAPRDPTVIAVAQAAALVPQAAAGQTGSASVGGAGDPASGRPSSDCVRERWLGSRTGFGDFLPEAIHKLTRVRQLEERFDKVLETEKIEALQAFAYGASHEINNPLANISTRAQTLLREEKDPERRRKLSVINSQAFRAHELIADLMLFARPPALSVAAVNLVELVDQVLAELAADAESQRTVLTRSPGVAPVIVSADSGHLAAALKSLCVNSLEALRLGGRIEVCVYAAATPPPDSDGGDWVEIVVADTGPGIGPEVRRHLFDPYFSGREAGRGLGLGLTKCWRIVTQHGGQIDVDSGSQPGATFRIRLPSKARP
jgi:hypothetical protein